MAALAQVALNSACSQAQYIHTPPHTRRKLQGKQNKTTDPVQYPKHKAAQLRPSGPGWPREAGSRLRGASRARTGWGRSLRAALPPALAGAQQGNGALPVRKLRSGIPGKARVTRAG